MPNPNAVVSRVVRLEEFSVELEGERRVRLEQADPRSARLAQILNDLARQQLPVYLEVDPETSVITRLLIPHVARVARLDTTEDGYEVELEFSHARHFLLRSSPDFAELERLLREALQSRAPVIVTEDDVHRIIHVRPFRPGPDGRLPPSLQPPPPAPSLLRWLRNLLNRVYLWQWWPWWCWRCMSLSRAQQVFDAMSATSCDPLTVPAPCIPFLYPDDGCWARAHEMCRLIIGMGLAPKKVWIQGSLYVSTRNNPNCYVQWGWHVAPTLCVRGPGFWRTQPMVIDPSLFQSPVSRATWKGVQGDPAASLTDTGASIYYLWGSVTDPTYTQTNYYLAFYRLQLQNRAVQDGPPPYANCP